MIRFSVAIEINTDPGIFSKESLLLQDGNSCANYADNSCEFFSGEEIVSLSPNHSISVLLRIGIREILTKFLLLWARSNNRKFVGSAALVEV